MFTKTGSNAFPPDEEGRYSPYVKRIIGMPGDMINYDNSTHMVYIKEKGSGEWCMLIEDCYIKEAMQKWSAVVRDGIFPIKVPEGCYFVMGDNRNVSSDSRNEAIGFIDRRDILGRVILRVYPFNRFGFITYN